MRPAVVLLVAAAGVAFMSWSAFAAQGVLIDPVTPGLAAGFVFLAGVGQLYGQKRQQVSEIRSAFGRYVSPAVVARLAENPERLQLGGEKRDLTVMFCDIRSFTTLSEGFTAVELSTFLNEYLSPMTDIILGEEGTVDKYMGDAIMAFWNAPLDDAAHGIHGVRAALRMRETLAELNLGWREKAEKSGRPFKPVKFGIGLNTGECSVGNMGSNQRFDYSALGDEVNIASRLEGSSKQFGVDIVASAATRDEAPEFAWLEIDQRQAQEQDSSGRAFCAGRRAGLRRQRRIPASLGAARRHAGRVPGGEVRPGAKIGGGRSSARAGRGLRSLRLLRQAVRGARGRAAPRGLGADDCARREVTRKRCLFGRLVFRRGSGLRRPHALSFRSGRRASPGGRRR